MPLSPDIAIAFQHVSFQIQHRPLLWDLNLTIAQGEILVLLGRSGSGKTTTLKLINRLLTPSHGEVLVCLDVHQYALGAVCK